MAADPYYTRYQHEEWLQLKAYDNVLRELQRRRNHFIDVHQKDAASRCWDEISELMSKREALAEKMIKDREDFSAAMIKVFLISSIAYAKAIEFQELIKKRTGSAETALSEDVKIMVKACESIALMIDTAGHDKQAYAFGDLIDAFEETFNKEINPKLDEAIEQFRKTRKFNLF